MQGLKYWLQRNFGVEYFIAIIVIRKISGYFSNIGYYYWSVNIHAYIVENKFEYSNSYIYHKKLHKPSYICKFGIYLS